MAIYAETMQLRAMPLARLIACNLQSMVTESEALLLSHRKKHNHHHQQQEQPDSSTDTPLVLHHIPHNNNNKNASSNASHVIDKNLHDDNNENNHDDDAASSEVIRLQESIARASLYYSQLRSICSSIHCLLTHHGGCINNSNHNPHLSIAHNINNTLDDKYSPPSSSSSSEHVKTIDKPATIMPEFNYKFIHKMITNDADEVLILTHMASIENFMIIIIGCCDGNDGCYSCLMYH